MNGDSYCDINLNAFWDCHCGLKAEATLALARVTDSKRYGRVRLGADGAVLSFEEKSGRGDPGWVNAGIYLLARSAIQAIPEKGAVSLEREIFPGRIGRGLYGYRTEGHFLDIGTPEAYEEAQRFFAPEAAQADRIDKARC
jgi:NDP-sugar pyrophosphorylase family protein